MTWTRVNKHWCGEEMNKTERAITSQAALDAIRQYRADNPLLSRQDRIAGCIEAARKVWDGAYDRYYPETEGGTP